MIWIIFIAVMVLSFIIQNTLQSRFRKYSQVPLRSGMTGAEVAMKMLNDNGIYDVKVVPHNGMLTDHYNPATKTVALSEGVYASRSVAAAAVAAHECGHAVQHAVGYAPLKMRSALVPVVSFASNIVQWVLLLGIIMVHSFPALLWFGIALFAMTTLFSFITLPVEINASRRAVAWLSGSGITDVETTPMAIDALKWAAYTYVIAAIGSLATLLYYVAIAMGSRISNIFAGGIEIWCNGSTTDFGSVCPSSNLGISTMTLSEQPVDQVPDQKAGEFSDKQKDHGPERPGLVESEGNGYDISDNRYPASQRQPYTIFVYIVFLLLQGFWPDLEPFFYPFPFPDPADPVCEHAAEPVAESPHQQASCRVSSGGEDSQIKRIRTERQDGRRQKGADEQPQQT